MFIEGDIFKIDETEYRLRVINKHLICWMEPVLYRDGGTCITSGLNKIFHMNQLEELEYMNVCY